MRCRILTYNIHGLPWIRHYSPEIVAWIGTVKPSIVCLQEVFMDSTRQYFREQLTRIGYTVVLPRDSGVAMFPSGLLTAFLDSEYSLRTDCFYPFLNYYNVEVFANKGFHMLDLVQKSDRKRITILNTHTQATTEVSWLFGNTRVDRARSEQMQQIVQCTAHIKVPILLVGDLNCERSPHPYIRFLHMPALKKHTFPSTGEDLDHIGWFPLQYAMKDCGFCDIEKHGPITESCEIVPLRFSDHYPVVYTVRIPQPTIR